MRFLPVLLFSFVLMNLCQAQKEDFFDKITTYRPAIFTDQLPGLLYENSGLIFYDGLYWFINDSGGNPAIYGLDVASGKIDRKIYLEKTLNHDWESITQDREYIYVGDFGNNYGNRKDLCVYRVRKDALNDSEEIWVKPDKIFFSYKDQHNFEKRLHGHSFDCESFVSVDSALLLFSKDWKSHRTQLYLLPNIPGSYLLTKVEDLNVDGLITDAALSPDKTLLVLCGYEDYYPFLVILRLNSIDNFSIAYSVKVIMPELRMVQNEGITFISDNVVIMSAEYSKVPFKLYEIHIDEILR